MNDSRLPDNGVSFAANLDSLAPDLQDYSPAKFVDSVSNPRTRQVLYELGSSLGDIPKAPDDKRPEWAVNAWKEFWRSLQWMPKKVQESSDIDQIGFGFGIASDPRLDSLKASPDLARLFDVLSDLIPKIRSMAAQAPPEEAASFFKAQKDGHERAAQLEQVSQRTKIFVVVAVLWEVVAEFKSTSELFHWLKTAHGEGKQPLLAPGTDSREIRAVCKIIGLRYPARGGRPKKTRL